MTKGVCAVAEERYRINLAKSEAREGYENGEAERIMAIHSETFCDLSEGQPALDGIEAKTVLLARLRALFARYKVRLIPTVVHIDVHNRFAVVLGWNQLRMTPHGGGETATRRMRCIEHWRKESDDQWRIVLTIDNQDQPPVFAEDVLSVLETDAENARQELALP